MIEGREALPIALPIALAALAASPPIAAASPAAARPPLRIRVLRRDEHLMGNFESVYSFPSSANATFCALLRSPNHGLSHVLRRYAQERRRQGYSVP